MRHVPSRPRKKNAIIIRPRRPRPYHPVDLEPLCEDEHENPDWLIGAN